MACRYVISGGFRLLHHHYSNISENIIKVKLTSGVVVCVTPAAHHHERAVRTQYGQSSQPLVCCASCCKYRQPIKSQRIKQPTNESNDRPTNRSILPAINTQTINQYITWFTGGINMELGTALQTIRNAQMGVECWIRTWYTHASIQFFHEN